MEAPRMSRKSRNVAFLFTLVTTGLLFVAVVHGQGPNSIPNGAHFPNPGGTASTISTAGSVDLTGPFFQSLGTNGRSCGSCHQPGDGMSVSAGNVQQRFDTSAGLGPIFRTVDGSNCDNLDVSTLQARSNAYTLLRTRGLIRIAIDVPAGADFQVMNVQNPYGCSDRNTISAYRRPLPTTNLRFLSTIMWDGRESTTATGTTKILFDNYPNSLLSNLAHQAVDATNGHAQGNGLTADQQQQIVDFEMALFSAQETAGRGDSLSSQGANGGAVALINEPFFISINSSVDPMVPGLEPPGGLLTPGDGIFTAANFNIFDAWANLPPFSSRAAIARGQALFNTTPITISGVAGLNDDAAAGGLFPGGIPSFTGNCATCHSTPNVGDHSFPTPVGIGVGDFGANSAVNMGGLDVSYLPRITVCRVSNISDCKTTTDLGQAMIDGKFDHVGKFKGPILRSLSSRAPYFHNGSARTLLDVVRFYEVRFGINFTPQEESDLVAFLSAL